MTSWVMNGIDMDPPPPQRCEKCAQKEGGGGAKFIIKSR